MVRGLPIIQVALVIRDLEFYATRHAALLGSGPWRVYEFWPHMMDRYEVYGEAGEARTLVALNDTKPQIELLQPLSGRSIYQDWLDERGEGLHHVGAVVESVNAAVAAAETDGVEVLSYGDGFGSDGSGRFAYFDTQAHLGMIFEVIEPPSTLGESLRRL